MKIGLDLETTGLDPLSARPRVLSVQEYGKAPWCVDLWTSAGAEKIEWLRRVVEDGAVVVGHNLKFDAKFLRRHYNIRLPNVWDTFRASHILEAGRRTVRHGLWHLYDRVLRLPPPTSDLSTSDWSGPLSAEQLDYAKSDVAMLFDLQQELERRLTRLGLVRTMALENNALAAEVDLELAGFPLDVERWRTLAAIKSSRRAVLGSELQELLPNPNPQYCLFGEPTWNLDSPTQLLESLRMRGHILADTSEESLAFLSDDALRQKLLSYREVAQQVKSFGVDYLKHVSPVTGRIHPQYFPYTAAGRYACREPNCQQIPRSEEFRRCFRPLNPNNVFVVCDYSQIELRVAAQVSGDRALREAYQQGMDIHTLTAQLLTGRTDKAARQIAKAVNFGLLYGMGAERLRIYARMSYGVDLSLEDATTYRDRWLDAYKGVRAWHFRAGNAHGVTRTLGGRLRHFDDEAYTERLNSPVQGTAADGLKAAMRLVSERLIRPGKIDLVNIVHDEMVVECPTENAPAVKEALRKAMIDGMSPFLDNVPVDAEAKVANTWAEK